MSGDSRHRSLWYKRLSSPLLYDKVVVGTVGVTWQGPDMDLGSLLKGKECEWKMHEVGWRFGRRATLSNKRNQTAASGELPPRTVVPSPPTNAE
jgi:hypothetical protein